MKLFLSFIIFFYTLNTVKCKIISTSLGKLEGKQVNQFYSFRKIPFAKPPLGELRFQKPEKPAKWKGVLDATEYGPACMSNSSTSNSPQKWIDEDCLHLNIFTSEQCLKSKDCAVVYYIHGGTLNYDSAVMFNDTYLLDSIVKYDVILVIPAFRLGIFSHFIVEDQSVAPTNLAIYDMLLGLEFVNQEIKNFGGDNKKVTLMGHSFGGTVATMMTFSTRINQDLNLFQRAVSMSSAYNLQPLDSQINMTHLFVEKANCTAPEKPKLSQKQKDLYSMKCLQKKDALELIRIQRNLEDAGYPQIDGMVMREPLFQEVPYPDYMNSPKRIPMLAGCTRYELDQNPQYAQVGLALGFENQKEVEEKYREDLKKGVYDFGNHSDETQAMFVHSYLTMEKLAKVGIPIYLYEYTYPKHAKHTDDLFYLMGVHRFEMDENEQKLSELYRKIFTNFVKYGAPDEGFEVADLRWSTYFDVFWNETSGERPHLKIEFEKNIIDYWFKDMAKYDKQVSEVKAKKNTPELKLNSVPVSETSDYKLTYFFISVSLVTLIFVTGCLFGKFCKSPDRREFYIQLEGTDDGFYYVKDKL